MFIYYILYNIILYDIILNYIFIYYVCEDVVRGAEGLEELEHEDEEEDEDDAPRREVRLGRLVGLQQQLLHLALEVQAVHDTVELLDSKDIEI